MSDIKIDWLDACPICSCSEHIVQTEQGSNKWLYSGDLVSCCECNHAGVIDADDGVAWVDWNEDQSNDPI